jgi:hypothetical protein
MRRFVLARALSIAVVLISVPSVADIQLLDSR